MTAREKHISCFAQDDVVYILAGGCGVGRLKSRGEAKLAATRSKSALGDSLVAGFDAEGVQFGVAETVASDEVHHQEH